MKTKGKFIVFEGIDGSGKSTQLKRLCTYLSEQGIPCAATCEPTHSPFGTLLRACLTGELDSDERAIAALFAADRLDHSFNRETGIRRMLEEGVTVLCDRFYFSSFAYNGGLVPLEWVISLNEVARREMRPDLTVYIELSPEEGMRRLARRGRTERYESFERQAAVHDRYLALFERFRDTERIAIVKSDADKDVTQAAIRRAVAPLFGL